MNVKKILITIFLMIAIYQISGCASQRTEPLSPVLTVKVQPKLTDYPANEAILELISRIIDAGKAGVMTNESAVANELGVVILPMHDKKRKIITGVEEIDSEEQMATYYGISSNVEDRIRWELTIRFLKTSVCIRPEIMRARFGTATGIYFGHQDRPTLGGRFEYLFNGNVQKIQASFDYVIRPGKDSCLRLFTVTPAI